MPKGRSKRRAKSASVPYVRGFKPPSPKHRLEAIGLEDGSDPLFSHLNKLFRPLPKPQSQDDWLAQYKEEGQSFKEFTKECPWLSNRKRKCMTGAFKAGISLPERYRESSVGLLPLGSFEDSACAPALEDLAEYTRTFLGLPVKILPKVRIEAEGEHVFWVSDDRLEKAQERILRARFRLQSRHDAASGRRQLRIGSILQQLRSILPREDFFLIAVTMEDLYDDDPDLFVAGMAAGNSRVAVFSFFRYSPALSYSPELWHDVQQDQEVSERDAKSLMLLRSCRLLVHEAAHLLGFAHCIYYECCMNGSGHLEEDFRQPMFLCPVDLHKLVELCGVDVRERYEKLLSFSQKHGFRDEVTWLKRCLGSIRKLPSNSVL